jgi:hypothetical protein
MAMKGASTGKNIYEKVKKVVQGLNSPVGQLARPVTVRAPDMVQETLTLLCFAVLSINVKNIIW